MSKKSKAKPQGAVGAIGFGSDGPEWRVIPFPEDKAERERLIAKMFVAAFSNYVAMQSEPTLAPFENLQQNAENDLDFTVETAGGSKLLELAEFAPLQSHGPTFADAPKKLPPPVKAELAADLIRMKSSHQGGPDRLLVLYNTEHGFWLDPIAVEHLRRKLAHEPPTFDRVYSVSPHDLEDASVTELFPGMPHHFFGEKSDEDLLRIRAMIPHPTEMIPRRTLTGKLGALYGRNLISAILTLDMPGKFTVGRASPKER